MRQPRPEYRIEPLRRTAPGGLRIALRLPPEQDVDGIPAGCPMRAEFDAYYTPAIALEEAGPRPHPCEDCAWAITDEELGHPVADGFVTMCGSPERVGPVRVTRIQPAGTTGKPVIPRRRRRATDNEIPAPATAPRPPTRRRALPSEDEVRAAYERIQQRREERRHGPRRDHRQAKATEGRPGPTQAGPAPRRDGRTRTGPGPAARARASDGRRVAG